MIKVESITIKEFRGIRDLTLNLNRKNYAICGRNGTGKSGVVDALEFGLTGNISRLSGKGTGEVTLKAHGPHVDSRNRPDKAEVTLEIFIPSLNKKARIQRNVQNPNAPIITPNDADVREVLEKIRLHPEFVLTRRELIKYVLSAPGDRAKEIQALLQLNQIEDVRTSLLRISNTSKKEVPIRSQARSLAISQLVSALGITELAPEKLLASVNTRRALLGLTPIAALTAVTSIKDGLASASGSKSGLRIPKREALLDIKSAQQIISRLTSEETATLSNKASGDLIFLSQTPGASKATEQENFLSLAIEIADEDLCPVCDTPWDLAELKKVINKKIEGFKEITDNRHAIEAEIKPLMSLAGELKSALQSVARYCVAANMTAEASLLRDYSAAIETVQIKFTNLVPLAEGITMLQSFPKLPLGISEAITKLQGIVAAIPEPTEQDAARDYLAIGQERLEAFRASSLQLQSAKERADMTLGVYNHYSEVSTTVLNDIYKQVEKDFRDFYRVVNNDDEGNFEAKLIPSIGKLGFDVDFYGRGFFPPGAYHSEGHQDSMGICLYLSLMRHLLESSFNFAVLDDVLMSVDSGHRREICTLLKTMFPDTQFILTTHDTVWLRHMQTTGIVTDKDCIQFRKWDVAHGPTEWSDLDIWNEIDEHIKSDDIHLAAATLRHFLEYIAGEICNSLRAKVEFRGDGNFDLGDLLPNALSSFKKLLNCAESATRTWGNSAEADALAVRKNKFVDLVTQSNVEKWQINPAVHFNEWENLGKEDFAPVAAAYKQLVSALFCDKCSRLFYAMPKRGEIEALRCDCGKLNANLVKNPAPAALVQQPVAQAAPLQPKEV